MTQPDTKRVPKTQAKMVPVPDPNWFGEFWAINHRWPTDDEVCERESIDIRLVDSD